MRGAVGEGESTKITHVHLWRWPSTIKRLRQTVRKSLFRGLAWAVERSPQRSDTVLAASKEKFAL